MHIKGQAISTVQCSFQVNLSTEDTPQFQKEVCRTWQKGWELYLEKCNLEKQGKTGGTVTFQMTAHSVYTNEGQ